MRQRFCNLAVVALISVLIAACGSTHRAVPTRVVVDAHVSTVSAASFADLSRPEVRRAVRVIDWSAVQRLADVVHVNNVAALQRVEASRQRVSRSGPGDTRGFHPAPASTGAGFAKGWDCVATAETGGDWHATGSHYSSALGVMNQAVRENAPPDVAAKILSGTATRAEQEAMASSIVAKFGVHAWAASTVAKCS